MTRALMRRITHPRAPRWWWKAPAACCVRALLQDGEGPLPGRGGVQPVQRSRALRMPMAVQMTPMPKKMSMKVSVRCSAWQDSGKGPRALLTFSRLRAAA